MHWLAGKTKEMFVFMGNSDLSLGKCREGEGEREREREREKREKRERGFIWLHRWVTRRGNLVHFVSDGRGVVEMRSFLSCGQLDSSGMHGISASCTKVLP
jgi:hypothetical protein